jgi:hypothetical protein
MASCRASGTASSTFSIAMIRLTLTALKAQSIAQACQWCGDCE